MSKYVVSLTREGRKRNMQAELAAALSQSKEVQILEGVGQNSITVLIPDRVVDELRSTLKYATISDYYELNLL